ncbi:cystatin domain-containing protein [Nocardia sp. NPDC052316]|uniref:cystatin family protein n=1 Tax=Nocardia sp. NPDC052316 TaxID=3364329 RepID=UPI0037C87210
MNASRSFKTVALAGACGVGLAVVVGAPPAQAGPSDGWSRVDPDDAHIQELASLALDYFNIHSNDSSYHRLIKVLDARSRVVSGVQYKIELLEGRTECRKNSTPATESHRCPLQEGGTTYRCTAEVWEKSWENFREVSSYDCR